jgi:UDP-N-acetylmuramoyl-tripeptide--D-alanyl-D-alanine ligase
LRSGDYVVVKGSRGVGLDVLTRKLKESLTLV